MRTLATSVLALSLAAVAGCGNYSSSRCGGYRYQCTAPVATNQYLIDAGAAFDLPENAIGIATDGIGWTVTWQGDSFPRRFSGSVSCPPGCVITQATVPPAAQNQIVFDDVSVAFDPGSFSFRANLQPVTFDLYIDGVPAVGNSVFVSRGLLSTTEFMPFHLATQGSFVANKELKAPLFVPKPPEEDRAESVVSVRAPGPKLEAGIRPPRSGLTH
jgi:hypothetical protein